MPAITEFFRLWTPYIVINHEKAEDRVRFAAAWAKTLIEMKWVKAASYDDSTMTFTVTF